MSKIKSHVLKNIKQNGLEPTSKFYFVTRNYFFALLFIVSVVVGAVSFSAILHDLVVGSQFYSGTSLDVAPTLFVQTIPLFWLVLLIFFTASAWFNYKRTDGIYRKENAIIVLASILFSLLIGLLIFRVGLTQQIDNVMKAYIPLYRVTIEERLERNAAYLEKKHLNERAIMMMLERERLRTLCLNQQRNDCFDQEIRVNIKVKENSN